MTLKIVECYSTGLAAEKVAKLPFTPGMPEQKLVVLEQEVYDLREGDWLDIDSVFVVTNDFGAPVRCASEIRICANPGPDDLEGDQATDWNGENATPNGMGHHMKVEQHGKFQVKTPLAKAYVKHIATAMRTTGTANFLTVDPSRGRMSLTHMRPKQKEITP